MLTKIFTILTVFFISIFSLAHAEENEFQFNVSDNSPASFFSSGIPVYFFDGDKIGVFNYSNDRFLFGAQEKAKVASISQMVPLVKKNDSIEDLILLANGSARFTKNDMDYACSWDRLQNCLYADMEIINVNVQNLMGKTNIKKISSSFTSAKNNPKFPLGSKLYEFNTVMPLYNFSNFSDLDSLVCSKNDDGYCRGVIVDGAVDKAALFELTRNAKGLDSLMFAYTDKNDLAYMYDLEKMVTVPYSASCIDNADTIEKLTSCSKEQEVPTGTIKEFKHKKGFSYWVVDYNNPETDNLIFWINSVGEPFKVYTNPYAEKKINLYNETAADTIFKVLK